MENNLIQELYPQRHTIRLRSYNYSWPGAYFVTVCTYEQQCIFGDITNDEMNLNKYGQIVLSCWEETPKHYPLVKMGIFVVMPNHIHAIVELNEETVRAGLRPAPTMNRPLSEIVRTFKSFSARRINELRKSQGQTVWQRNYYEHVIRNEEERSRRVRNLDKNTDSFPISSSRYYRDSE